MPHLKEVVRGPKTLSESAFVLGAVFNKINIFESSKGERKLPNHQMSVILILLKTALRIKAVPPSVLGPLV